MKNKKFWLSLIALSVLGLAIGILVSTFSLDKLVFDFLKNIGELLSKNIFLIFVGSILAIDLAIYILFRVGKKDLEKSYKNEDSIEDDKKLSISIAINSASILVAMVLFFTYVVDMEKTISNLLESIAVLILFVGHFFFFSYMQKLQVELLKVYNPSKYDQVLDMKFHQKFMDSLDERELFESYRAGFWAYRSMMITIFGLILVLGIFSMGMGSSLGAVYALGLTGLVGTLVYLLEAIRKK